MRTLGRWLVRLVFGLAALVLLVVLLLAAGTRSAAVRDFLRRQTVAQLERALHARVEIGAIGGSMLHTLSLDDVRVAVEGRTLLRIPRLEVAYALFPLLGGELRLAHVVVERPWVRLVRRDGKWVVPGASDGRPRGREPRRRDGPGLTLVIERLVIQDGRLELALLDADNPPRRFAATRLGLESAARLDARRQEVQVARLGFVPRGIPLPPVEAVLSAAAERDGAVRVSRLEVSTTRTRLAARATVRRGEHLDGELSVHPLAAADVRAFAPASRLVADVRARVRARGPWHAIAAVARTELLPGGALTAHATVDAAARPLGHATRVRLTDLDPGAAVAGLPRGALRGAVWASGRGVDARRPLTYGISLQESSIAGRELDRLDVRGRGTRGLHRLDAAVAAPLGEATVDARLALAAPARYRMAAHYTVARLDLLAPATWGWVVGGARLRGRGTDPDDRRARLALSVTGASVHGVPVSRGAVHARLDGARLAPVTVALDAPDLHLEGRGQADVTRRSGDLTASARADLGGVGAYLGQPLTGDASLSLGARGAIEDLSAELTAGIDRPAFERASADRMTARLGLRALGSASPAGDVHLEAAGLRVGGGAPHAVRAEVGWSRRGGEDRADVTAVATGDDARVQRVAAGIVRTPARTSGELRELTLSPPQGPVWRLAEPASATVAESLTVDRLVLEAADQRVTVAGRVALRGGTSDASVTFDTIRLAPVCAVAGLPSCAGRLSGRLALTGTARAPVADVTARVERLRVREVPYGVLEATAHAAELRAALDASVRHPEAGDVHLQGDVPLDLAWGRPQRDLSEALVDLRATAANLDLTILAAILARQVESSAGRLSLDFTVQGPRRAPRVSGELAIDDGSVALRATGVPYEKIRARLIADGTRIQVRALHAEAGEGDAEVTGTVDLPLGTPGAADLALRLDEFYAVRQEAYEAALSGVLGVRGALDAPRVEGQLEVDHAVVRPAGLPASGPSVLRDPTIVVVGTVTAPEEDTASAAPGALEGPLALDLTVTIARNAWIRRNDADIEIAGELKIAKLPGEPPRVTGQIRLIRGWYAFQGRRFTLRQGTITFTGGTPPAPTFDITAFYRAGDYEIEVRITGSAEKPTLVLSSDPPLEQADILSVLLFGKPAHELGRGQSVALQEQALQLAAGYVVPELRTSVMNALGLDTLDVELPQGAEQAGKVSAGRYVAQDVFLSLSQELGPRAGQEIGIEYALGKNVSARGSTSTRGTSAIDLFWHWRY